MNDWPDAGALEASLQGAVAAAEECGLGAMLLGEFGADRAEGVDGAGGLASAVGAAAGLTKAPEEAAAKGGAISLGCWDGSQTELQRLREGGHSGLVLKDACNGDVAWGARTKSPSLAAQALTKLIKASLSKGNTAVWGGAGGTAMGESGGQSMESYFNRDNQPGKNKIF